MKGRSSGASLADVDEQVSSSPPAPSPAPRRDVDRLAMHVAFVDRHLDSMRESFWDVGCALREIRDGRLYRRGESTAKTFDDFLGLHAWFTPRYAHEIIEISAIYTRSVAMALGHARGIELMKYASVKLRDPASAQRLGESGSIEGKPLYELDTEDLRDLRRRAAKKKRKIGASERNARRRARQLDDWLTDRGLPGSVVKAVPIEGTWIVQTNLDARVLDRFFAGVR